MTLDTPEISSPKFSIFPSPVGHSCRNIPAPPEKRYMAHGISPGFGLHLLYESCWANQFISEPPRYAPPTTARRRRTRPTGRPRRRRRPGRGRGGRCSRSSAQRSGSAGRASSTASIPSPLQGQPRPFFAPKCKRSRFSQILIQCYNGAHAMDISIVVLALA